jgi:hypothetical protein
VLNLQHTATMIINFILASGGCFAYSLFAFPVDRSLMAITGSSMAGAWHPPLFQI